MSYTLPGNQHADAADRALTAATHDAAVLAHSNLAVAHEIRTLSLILLETHEAAHGIVSGDPFIVDVTARLGL